LTGTNQVRACFFGFAPGINLQQIRQHRFSFLLFLCWILPLPHRAEAGTFELTPSLYYFHYQEFDTGNRLLNEENGVLPGLKLGFNHAVNGGIIQSRVSYFSGEVDYDGQTQSGAPHETDTSARLIKLGLKWISRDTATIPGQFFLGFQYWNWDRDIQTNNGVLGLHEVYTWNELELGIKFESEQNQYARYWLDISALYVFNPQVEVSLPSSKVNLDLGQEPGFRVRAGKTWGNDDGLSSSFSLFAEYWEFGRSDAVFTDDFFGQTAFLVEPRSESFHSGMEFIVIYSF
jgi:hypothetical protein